MTKKQLRYALSVVTDCVNKTRCKDINHTVKQVHSLDELCGAEYHLYKQMNLLSEYVKGTMNEKQL
jgi:hypothetical protein